MRRLAWVLTVLSVVAAVATLGCALLAIWGGDERWSLTGLAAFCSAMVLGFTAFSLFLFSNEERT